LRERIFPSKGGLDLSKSGQKPPFEGKKGFPPNVQYQNIPTEFSFGIGWENTGKTPTDTKPEYRIGVQLYSFQFHLKKQLLVLAGKKSPMCPVPIPFSHLTNQPTNTTTHQPTNPPIASFNNRA
jgi:hypothetical protein